MFFTGKEFGGGGGVTGARHVVEDWMMRGVQRDKQVERLSCFLERGLNRVRLDLGWGPWCNPCVFLYSSSISSALSRFDAGSQVSSLDPYPFHLIRYRYDRLKGLCVMIASTSYWFSPSITSGGGWR